MINRTPIRTSLLTTLLLTLFVAGAQFARSQALTDNMPTDPQISMGKFQNGMTYYIRANKKPEKRAELRLVVKTGSILEDEDQLGMAHLVDPECVAIDDPVAAEIAFDRRQTGSRTSPDPHRQGRRPF